MCNAANLAELVAMQAAPDTHPANLIDIYFLTQHLQQ